MIFGHFKDPFERLPSRRVCRDHSCPSDKRDDPKEADKTSNIVDARENPPCRCHDSGMARVHLTRTRSAAESERGNKPELGFDVVLYRVVINHPVHT